ncbi:hypothetical protein IC582_021145 [Cucumis melo]
MIDSGLDMYSISVSLDRVEMFPMSIVRSIPSLLSRVVKVNVPCILAFLSLNQLPSE